MAMAYFDASSRPTGQRVVTGGRDLVTHTACSGLGRPVSATLPVGVTTTRTGDVSAPSTTRTTRTTYAADPLMRAKTVSLPGQTAASHVATGGDTATYAYSRGSTQNRLDSITEGSTTESFAYNANGSATQVAAAPCTT